MTMLLAADLALHGRLAPGWVETDGARLAGAAHGPPPRAPDERLDGILAPALCDLQVNGAGGHEVTGGAAALDAIDAIPLAHGVTSYLPTLVSPDDATAERALAELQARAADPASPVAGVHIEGPFLSPEHAGVHPLERLRRPSDGIPAWIESPAVRLVTLAPELPGALELIARLHARGIVVGLGHSGADAETTLAAIDAGARLATHVFNAMTPLLHRAPGLAGVALLDERVHVTVIADGIHVDPLALELVRRAAGRRVALITDATPAADAPAGRYAMAGMLVEAAGGAARTRDGELAGSTLTLDAAVRNWGAMTEATLAEALFAAGEAPRAAAGLGEAADLVLLDRSGFVRRVLRRGAWVA
jgi:N-acetylglucosamine-6-phosphate deacetylase